MNLLSCKSSRFDLARIYSVVSRTRGNQRAGSMRDVLPKWFSVTCSEQLPRESGPPSDLDKLANQIQDFPKILKMGNDGGSIPTRRELVREAAKDKTSTQVKEVQTEKLEHYWSHCALSQKPLAPPIVSDSTGNLYNKDAILEHLLGAGKQSQDENIAGNDRTAGSIKSLRDVVEVQFGVEEEEEPRDSDSSPTRLVCPVSGKKLGPGVKAVYLVPCGHAFAESAVREMPGEQCLQASLHPVCLHDIH